MPAQNHYHQEDLYEKIVDAYEAIGKPRHQLSRQDLALVDELHVRGAAVSQELALAAAIAPGETVLDAGCGIGGASRMLADAFKAQVTGVDLTPGYIRTAQLLSKLTTPHSQPNFILGDVTALHFADEQFEVAWTQHVQMNISDKKSFYRQILRVLKHGGRFIYYDIFSSEQVSLQYPLPWASTPEISFLISHNEVENILTELGFEKRHTKDETEAGIEFLDKMVEKINAEGLPPVGLHLLLGPNALEKITNLLNGLRAKHLSLFSGLWIKA